jgi:DNA-directed RNA polymerase specialized sigma24 family protein
MADQRLASLESTLSSEEGEGAPLIDTLPDVNALDSAEQRLLKLEIDNALKGLTPVLHEVVVARFILGESCAEIGRRFNRTEQTISGWVREATRQLKVQLEALGVSVVPKGS